MIGTAPVMFWMAKFNAPRVLIVCLPALAFSLPPACVSYYDNPPLPRTEVAVVEFVDNSNGYFQRHIDGKPVWGGSAAVTLLPGEHNLAFVYATGCVARDEPSGVNLNAKAGHGYELHTILTGERIWTWVVDKNSGEVVAGAKPQ